MGRSKTLTNIFLFIIIAAFATSSEAADTCSLVRNSFQSCIREAGSYDLCSRVGAGYSSCRRAGLPHGSCLEAQAGFSDCFSDSRSGGACIDALSGYAECRAGGIMSSESCKRAGINFSVCKRYRGTAQGCLEPAGTKEKFACSLE